MAVATGENRGALHPGRRDRHGGPAAPREIDSPARPAGDRREPRRRQHHHRHGAGRQVEARWPHPAARHHHARHQCRSWPQAALRSAQGFPADHDGGRHPRLHRPQQGPSGQGLQGVRRMGEQAAGKGPLRHVRARQPAASVGRAVQDPKQAQHGVRRLQGCRRRPARRHGRPCAADHRRRHAGRPARHRRPPDRAGRLLREALARRVKEGEKS